MYPPPIVDGRRLVVPLGGPHRTLSWALSSAAAGGGLIRADTVVWQEVDGVEIVDTAVAATTILMLTSRDVSTFEVAVCESGDFRVRAVATVGLGNALAAGDPPGPMRPGTINLLVQCSHPLEDGALAEGMALAAEARTAVVVSARIPSRRSTRIATGTGTDCIVMAAPDDGRKAERWVGKHTPIGSLIGAAVGEVISRGVAAWIAENMS